MSYAVTKSKTAIIDMNDENYLDGISIRGFTSANLRNIIIKSSTESAIRVHNGQSLIIEDCLVKNAKGDGVYLTKSHNSLLNNVKVEPPKDAGADCVQFAYENDDNNISKNAHIKGCILLQGPNSTSLKGGLVCEKTDEYLIEQNYIQGRNFGFSSIGNHATTRSCLIDYARLNNYSFGYGVGEQHDLYDHQVYDCTIRNANRGISLSSFGDSRVLVDGIIGYQRKDFVLHDCIIENCDVGFFADRAWTGRIYRNIFMQCQIPISLVGKSKQTEGQQFLDQILTNDGSFKCTKNPTLNVNSKGKATVSGAEWSDNPDEIKYIWRENGLDVAKANGTSFYPKRGLETSCVVLARKGENWMLAIAEMDWGNNWTPRAYTEGYLPWRNRYYVAT